MAEKILSMEEVISDLIKGLDEIEQMFLIEMLRDINNGLTIEIGYTNISVDTDKLTMHKALKID